MMIVISSDYEVLMIVMLIVVIRVMTSDLKVMSFKRNKIEKD